MQVYQRFHVDIVPLACNFVKDETLTQVFSFKFSKFLETFICQNIAKGLRRSCLAYKYVFYRPGHNAKGGPHGIEF